MTTSDATSDSTDKWRFVVLVSSFFLHFLVAAVSKSFGVLISEMVVLFDTSEAVIGLLCSLPVTTMLMTCPIVAHVLQSGRVRPRAVAVVGAFLSSLSLILSGYTRSLVLLVVYLLTLGTGLSMAYMTQLVALNDFFPKSFIVMNSLTEIGSTLGVVFVPLVIERCNEAYGYNGAMMILGGILLHLGVTGATIKPPRPDRKDHRKTVSGSSFNSLEGYTEDEERCLATARQSGLRTYAPEDIALSSSMQQRVGETDSSEDDPLGTRTSSDTNPLLNKEATKVKTEHSDQTLDPTEEDDSNDDQRQHRHPVINYFLDCIFIRQPLFPLILPAQMLSQYGLYPWRLFLVPHAEWRGFARSDAVLKSTVGGIGALVGRILLVISLHFGANPFLLYIISSALTAVTFFVDPWVISFWVMLVTAFLQGWTLYVSSSLWAALCKLTSSPTYFKLACGYAALVGGIGGNAGGFLSGAIFDATQSFTKVFLCLGAVYLVIVIDLLIYMILVRAKGIRPT